MFARLTACLLLGCFAFWASGAALYAHERLERSGPAGDDEALVGQGSTAAAAPDSPGSADSSASPVRAHSHHREHQHDRENCRVCQLLATMKADRGAVPSLLESHQIVVVNALRPQSRPPVVFSFGFAPIRGPPHARPACA